MGKMCGNCFQETLNDRGVCLVCGFDEAANRAAYPMALPSGSILYGRYIVGRVLGQGGFGITYAARDYQTGQTVAIKEFFPSSMATRSGRSTVIPYAGERGENYGYGRETFLEEARMLAEFHGHPNIVQVYVYFEENNTAYFVMEYVRGTNLREYIAARGGRITWQEATEILVPVMEALEAVHQKGIIHRDIAPDNIYISDSGVVKLLDFGASRYSLGNVSHSLDVILKPGYTPKEQYRRRSRQGPYTDVYSLGATFYNAITGVRPDESLDRDEEDTLPYPSTLGAKVTEAQEEVLLRAMAVEPGDRYQTMSQFQTALTNPRPEPKPLPPVKPVPSKKPEEERNITPEPRKRPKWLIPVGAAAAVLLGILIGTVGGSDKPVAPTEPPAMAVHTEPAENNRETQIPIEETEAASQPTEPATQPTEPVQMTPATDANGVPLNALAENPVPEEAVFEKELEEYAFGTQALRKEVATITFLSSTATAPETAADASQLKNGRVRAWAVQRKELNLQTKQPGNGAENGSTEAALEFVSENLYDLYIAADGGVYAPANSNYLFVSMPNLTTITFGDAFHTEYAQGMAQMFSQDKSLLTLDLSQFDTSNVTNMHCMFQSCEALTELDLSGFDTSKVEQFSYTFSKCTSLNALNISNFNTGSATTMHRMFNGCAALETLDVSGFDTSNVTRMDAMFQKCTALAKLDVSGFVTDKCTDMSYMFMECTKLDYLDVSRFNTSNVTSMRCMFANCRTLQDLNVSGFKTSNVTDMTAMFQNCESLTELNVNGFKTGKVTEMVSMFRACKSLTTLDISKFDTSKVKDMTCMFKNCESLTNLNLAKFKSGKGTVLTEMFAGCENLKTFKCSDSRIKKVYQDR